MPTSTEVQQKFCLNNHKKAMTGFYPVIAFAYSILNSMRAFSLAVSISFCVSVCLTSASFSAEYSIKSDELR